MPQALCAYLEHLKILVITFSFTRHCSVGRSFHHNIDSLPVRTTCSLKFRLQVRDQDDLRHDGIVEWNIAFAFHEIVVEEKVQGIEPA